MFGVISSLTSSPTYSAFPASDDAMIKLELQNRIKTIQSSLTNLAKKSGVDISKFNITYSDTLGLRNFGGSRESIEIPLLYLIDLKKDFSISDSNDLKLKLSDLAWIQKIFDQLCKIYGQKPFNLTDEEKNYLIKLLTLILDEPDNCLHSFRFAVLHEMGHIHNKELDFNFIKVTLPELLLFLALFILIFAALALLGMITASTGLIIVIPTTLAVCYISYKISLFVVSRCLLFKREFAADQFALKAFGDPKESAEIRQGGIFFFEKMCKIKLNLTFFEKLNDFLTIRKHPTDEERLKRIRNFKAVNLSSPATTLS